MMLTKLYFTALLLYLFYYVAFTKFLYYFAPLLQANKIIDNCMPK